MFLSYQQKFLLNENSKNAASCRFEFQEDFYLS